MEYKEPLFNLSEQEKKQLTQTRYIYGDSLRERLAYTEHSLPRFASLGRKLLSHYGGDNYNPHTVDLGVEYFIRFHIQHAIEQKIFYRQKDHDWEFADNFFKKVVGELLEIDIPYDQDRLDKGLWPDRDLGIIYMSDAVQ